MDECMQLFFVDNRRKINMILLLALVLMFINTITAIKFIPSGRSGQAAIYYNYKLYFYNNSGSNEFFTLDVSNNFNINAPKFDELDVDKLNISSYDITFATSVIFNSVIYSFGSQVNNTVKLFSMNLSSSPLFWKSETDSSRANAPYGLDGLTSIIDSSTGKIYLFNGYDTMYVWNIYKSNWRFFPIDTTTCFPKVYYTATYLENLRQIIYLGGLCGNYQINIDEILPMDQTAQMKNYLPSRAGHSACLVANNKILIYGGHSDPPLNASNILAILEVNNDTGTYIWNTPNIAYQTDQAIPFYHSATLVNNTYMIVAFGNINKQSVEDPSPISVLKVDAENDEYQWLNSIDEPISAPTNQSNNNIASTSKKEEHTNIRAIIIISGICSGYVVLLILIVIIVFIKHKTKPSRNFVIK
ncbi:11416_t:CDS:2 [Ambispora leptoticha]|uniref:11416_t:CDS:1 n=1 Tax=Ambispora leptoticha TaxID=144679 RepID=A0A9N9D5B6_9GLOM|nr:11416_t:CDS:2 [Ambispora leptoticha]